MDETSKVLHLEYSFVGCWKLDTPESRAEIPGKIWKMVLKDGEDSWTDYVRNEEVKWIGHMLRKNCHLKHVIEGNIEGGIEVTDRQEDVSSYWMTLRKRIPDTERRSTRSHLWTLFRSGYGPVLRQTTMNTLNGLQRQAYFSIKFSPPPPPTHTHFRNSSMEMNTSMKHWQNSTVSQPL